MERSETEFVIELVGLVERLNEGTEGNSKCLAWGMGDTGVIYGDGEN